MKNDFIILDGAMGTMLQNAGLPAGYAPELLNIENPELITEIGKKYIAAGSDIIYANTFGANRYKLKGADAAAVVTAGVRAARRAAEGTDVKVALDIGPIGQLIEPVGQLSFDAAYDIFKEVVTAGESAGADLIVFETMSDLYEVKAGVLAAKENTSLPVWVSMTFEKNSRTFLGVTVPCMALTLSGLSVDAVGFNCSLGPGELLPMVRELAEWTRLPIILKPNAGLPDPLTGEYGVDCREFASELSKAAQLGATILGGCCGTTPEYIKALKDELKSVIPQSRRTDIRCGICSGRAHKELSGITVIGERINPTGKRALQQALRTNDITYILEKGIEQEDAGADVLDVNVGLPEIDEPEMMKNVIKGLQSVVNLPLQIDSSNIKAIEAGLRYYNGKPIVNSVNGSPESLKSVLPLCKKYGAAVIGLTMDEEGIPSGRDGRCRIAEVILDQCRRVGIPDSDVIIDCLTLTAATEQSQAKETLGALRYVSEVLSLHTTLGVSNISFGLPERERVSAVFLAEALASGLDMPIVNPNSSAVMDVILSHKVLSGEDAGCSEYISRYAKCRQDKTDISAQGRSNTDENTARLSIDSAILKGLSRECAELTERALLTLSELEVINTLLIPALDRVGRAYEAGDIFLPQLISSANAASCGFDAVKKKLAASGKGDVSRGKIIVATVKGDIHDIGKNIVKVVLENYGYTVIDLGRDVAPELILETAIREDVRLIGLSALMTTTVPAMQRTVRLIKDSGHECKIWVGGAVLTPEYADAIGADYYAEDAKASADIAKEVLG